MVPPWTIITVMVRSKGSGILSPIRRRPVERSGLSGGLQEQINSFFRSFLRQLSQFCCGRTSQVLTYLQENGREEEKRRENG